MYENKTKLNLIKLSAILPEANLTNAKKHGFTASCFSDIGESQSFNSCQKSALLIYLLCMHQSKAFLVTDMFDWRTHLDFFSSKIKISLMMPESTSILFFLAKNSNGAKCGKANVFPDANSQDLGQPAQLRRLAQVFAVCKCKGYASIACCVTIMW